ncbi:MAG: hypothetical protein JNL26_18980 [Gemmatimonadetes bacterium]|nr:hypothetical protein [Gemmatimonadota bacterium]
MRKRSTRAALILACGVAACADSAVSPDGTLAVPVPDAAVLPGTVIPVPTVDSLYRVVNNAAYAGAVVQLAPGTYALDPTRSNGGRLELQSGMSLQGSVGNRADVVIDASALAAAQYLPNAAGTGTTGAIRLGRGTQRVSWLTVRNAVNGVSAIATDLDAGPTQLTLSYLNVTGNRRGIDIRSTGSAMAGRVMVVTVSHCVIENNTANAGQGIRMLNSDAATGAVILATFSNNLLRQNRIGLFVGNLATTASTISLSSTSDVFQNNAVGLGTAAGVASSVASTSNTVSLSMTFPSFLSNTSAQLSPGFPFNAGLSVEGGTGSGAGLASSNTAAVSIIAPTFSGNIGNSVDIRAWGARSTSGIVAGTYNVASVAVVGATPTVVKVASDPVEAVPTNVVSVVP